MVVGGCIHVCISLILGMIYGVLMPMLPRVPSPVAWGALLMPIFWTAMSFAALGVFNPAVRALIDWPWFVVSQFIFGIVAALVFMRLHNRNAITAGALCGIAGGLLMPIPAVLWAVSAGHSMWYPINLLSAMGMRHAAELTPADLEQFHSDWLVGAIALHALLSISFGLAFALVLPRIPRIPTPMVWGGLVMPLLVDRVQLCVDGRGESRPAGIHRLAVVHGLAVRFWCRGGRRRGAFRDGLHRTGRRRARAASHSNQIMGDHCKARSA